ncbi:hypothetical protein [Bdellovibrio sp. BCCA]|uniref:hypothetical protein n=1 Tax=Bdellovibrio sp. BCCA TaxID=3136281 RepID=UPI0030F0DAD5
MNVFILSIFLFMSSSYAASDFLVDRLKAKGFGCSPAEGGDICKVSSVSTPEFKYSQPIAIFVPKNVRRPTSTVVHLHGHRCVCEPCDLSPEKMVSQFEFSKQMKEAGLANSVLIAPVSIGHCVNFEKELAPQFDQFMKWVNSSVDPTQDRLFLSGHSGAGRALGTIVGDAAKKDPTLLKKIDGVVLLDATYSTRPAYLEQWSLAAKGNKNLKVYSVINTGGGTEVGSKMLKSSMPQSEVEIEKSKTPHCKIPGEYFRKGLKTVQPGSGSSSASLSEGAR